ncbi:hypothetical protein GCM10010402_77210 [Actinomadura luteofluorescens]
MLVGRVDRVVGGLPLPEHSAGSTGLSEVCRSLSMWKFSTAMGLAPPEASPNGPEPPPSPAPPIPGPPS